MSREGGDWLCSACQHLNFKKRDSCQRCKCPKYGADNGINETAVLAGDWYCNTINCGAHNYASRTSCYMCGSIKDDYCPYSGGMIGEALPGWKSGDWICSRLGCGQHNYASRMECFRCKTPRSFGGAI
ncbi:Zinc finger, RanBP2-type protein [Actinidia chinensis var. chinensis]|uniref:Zinc finger, RanBP2-type protein n=1 Tax=Actinidia chinensis var. chinensis TaxID=1590841 RepID=A0A2R6P2I5_ACTCC|nr:Zinc finger, RanBP2-type protein [Actinidia chinensis var. chinensis]